MGRPKLLLPWRDKTLIQHTLAAWHASGVTHTIVVTRPDDTELAAVVRDAGAEVVVAPVAPPEMKDSIQIGLKYVTLKLHPAASDVWLLAPADMPQLSANVVRQLLVTHNPADPRILVPVHGAERGHPVLFPWTVASDVASLSTSEGVNVIKQRYGWTGVAVPELLAQDIDSPEDYERLGQ
jgi:molybdenum cofactor cytidylyltransferase